MDSDLVVSHHPSKRTRYISLGDKPYTSPNSYEFLEVDRHPEAPGNRVYCEAGRQGLMASHGGVPNGRQAEPREVAGLVAFLVWPARRPSLAQNMSSRWECRLSEDISASRFRLSRYKSGAVGSVSMLAHRPLAPIGVFSFVNYEYFETILCANSCTRGRRKRASRIVP